MVGITEKQLTRLVEKKGRTLPDGTAAIHAGALSEALAAGEINTNMRLRHFVAQLAHESGGFRSLVESTRYKNEVRLDELFVNVQGAAHAKRLIAAGPEAIANTIYAHKLGNGGVASGDGWRFRGRGYIMLTGRSNYKTMGEALGLPLTEKPQLVGEPGVAAGAAAWFWKSRNINAAADANKIERVTSLVNGSAMLHLRERREWLEVAEEIWPSGLAGVARRVLAR